EHVVDLVGARVAEVLALEVDPRAARLTRETLGEIERGRSPRIRGQERAQAVAEGSVSRRSAVRALELDQRTHERFGNEAAAEPPEMAAGVGQRGRVESRIRHADGSSIALAAVTKQRSFSGSFFPGRASTPESTSTAYGLVSRTAARTVSGVSPPER